MIQNQTRRSYGIDVARGVCLVLMMIDHLPSNIFEHFTNVTFGPFGFFTGASGFVFLSGLVSSSVYGSTLQKHGLKAAWRRALQRAGRLYIINMALFLLVLAGIRSHFLTAHFWLADFSLFFTNPGRALYLGILLIYRPGFFDILPMYVLFLLITIPVLNQFRMRHGWTVFWISLACWIWVQFSAPEHPDSLHPLAYQVYFIGGLAVGSAGDIRARLLNPKMLRAAKICISAAFLLFLVRFGMAYIKKDDFSTAYLHILVHLQKNGPVRILNFAIFGFSAAFVWVRISERLRRSGPFQWLSYIGRHSLQVFIWSILIAYGLAAATPVSAGRTWSMAILLFSIPSLAIPANLHERFRKLVRR